MIFKGVTKLEVNGVDYFSKLDSGSFNINLPKAGETIKHYTEGSDTPIVAIPGRRDPLTLSFQLTDLSSADLAVFTGGTDTTGVFTPAANRVSVELPVIVTGSIVDGKQFELNIANALIKAGVEGNPTLDGDGMATLTVDVEAVSSWTIQDVAV